MSKNLILVKHTGHLRLCWKTVVTMFLYWESKVCTDVFRVSLSLSSVFKKADRRSYGPWYVSIATHSGYKVPVSRFPNALVTGQPWGTGWYLKLTDLSGSKWVGEPVLGYTAEQQEDIWNYVVLVDIEGQESFSGILIQSSTHPDKRHLVVNFHSFYGML
jgi:hypothetical protein